MKASLALAFALLLICTGTALASTPDGTPPSGETVCDAEVGAAYGLCTAYCEAMDCESDDPHASETACNKVGTKFLNITGRDVPCEVPAVACPCASPEFNAILAGANSCFDSGETISVNGTGLEFARSTRPEAPPSRGCEYRTASGTFVAMSVTVEEAAACSQLIFDAIESRDLTCATPE